MSILRTDGQAALNDLLKAARETIDHYRDATELVDEKVASLFRDISRERRGFIVRLEEAVRASGSLPRVPDPDKEAGEMLLHHVAAMIKSDYAPDVFAQRIDGENNLAEQISEAKNTTIEPPTSSLLEDFAHHIAETIAQLQSAQDQLPPQDK
jgi:hypothetical protein